MALDQTLIPKDLRPINVARTVGLEPRISVPAPVVRPLETVIPTSVPLYSPATVPDAGLVVAGYRNPVPGIVGWCPRPPAPLGHFSVALAGGLLCGPSLGSRIVPNAPDQPNKETVAGFGGTQGLSSRDSSKGGEQLSSDAKNRNYGSSSLGSRSSGEGAEMGSEEGGNELTPGKKVKLMCSFGGKILPRPSDGMLRYVGGQTRIISVRKNVRFNELEQKMVEMCGQPVVIKYQLPDEDLESLVSISCLEDLDNMMEEYEKLLERSSDGSAKLRVFLFSAYEIDSLGVVQLGDLQDSGWRYVEAVNSVSDVASSGIMRKESIESTSSTQNSDLSGMDAVDSSGPGLSDFVAVPTSSMLPPLESLVTSCVNVPKPVPIDPVTDVYADAYAAPMTVPVVSLSIPQPLLISEKPVPVTIQQQPLMHELQQPGATKSVHYPQAFVDPHLEVSRQIDYVNPPNHAGFPNQPLLPRVNPPFIQQAFQANAVSISPHQFLPPIHMTITASMPHVGIRPAVMQPVVQTQETRLLNSPDEISRGAPRLVAPPIGQTYPAHPGALASGIVSGNYGRAQVAPTDHVVIPGGAIPLKPVMPEKFAPPDHVLSGRAVPLQPAPVCMPEKITPFDNVLSGAVPLQPASVVMPEKFAPSDHVLSGGAVPLQPAPVVIPENFAPSDHVLSGGAVPLQSATVVMPEKFARPDHVLSGRVVPLQPAPVVMPEKFAPSDHVLSGGAVPLQSAPVVMPEKFAQSGHVLSGGAVPLQPAPVVMPEKFPPSDHILSGGAVPLPSAPVVMPEKFDPPGHVLSGGSVPLQPAPVVMPEKFQGVEDRHMRHKGLPHSHSDPVVREKKDGDASSALHASSVYHSFRPEDAITIQQMEKSTGPKGILNNLDHQDSDVLWKDNVGAAQVKPLELLLRETVRELPNKIPVGIPKKNEVPIVPHDQFRQLGGSIENMNFGAPKIYIKGENYVPPIEKNQKEEILDGRTQHDVGRDMFLNNTLIGQSTAVHSTKQAKPVEMLSKTIGVIPGHDSQPVVYGPVQSPFLANPVLYPQTIVGGQHLKPFELQSNNPAYSAVESALNAANLPIPSSLSSSTGVGDVKDSSSNSLFSNEDPWTLQHDAHPPGANIVQIKIEGFGGQDHFDENLPVMSGIPNSETNLHSRNSSNKDLKVEQSRSSKGSEEGHVKQELQNVAEGVAASVFRTPSNPEIPAKVHRSGPDTNHEGEVSQTDEDDQQTAYLKDISAKLPERPNFGYPVFDCLDKLQIIRDTDLEELRELGSGTFGTVYHGKWRGTDVAIKRINDRCFAGKPSEQERMIDDFWNEAKKLAGLHHPNVVAFYGVVLDSPGGSVATVTEYMVNGSLRHALQKNARNLDKRKRLLVAMDVAFGMEYLHGKNIVHFDLKSDNLLVNLRDPHRPVCKVGDLGLSKVKCRTLISGGVRGTLPWMAPELLNGISSLVSEKVDVFSFGIVLWELLTGEEPYADLHYGAIIGGIVSNTLRPPIPDICDMDWKLLMEHCWSPDPSERPSFTEIVNELRLMASKLSSRGQAPSQSQPRLLPQQS